LTVEGRIKALARAHTLLSDSRWRGADLGTLVFDELAPYRAGEKVVIGGPNIALLPATAQVWRWRCMSLPPMRQSTARCRR